MPCFKARHHGCTPDQFERLVSCGVEGILPEWAQHLETRFPKGLSGRDIDGICLASLDTDAAGCVSSFIASGTLDQQRLEVLRHRHDQVCSLLHKLPEEARSYFTSLAELTRVVLSEHDDVA